MEIAIFNAITTEEAIAKLEAESESYVGLYVEMSDPKQRKFVKDNAAEIAGIRKKLNRARIDITKENKLAIDAEFKAIDDRLEVANKPFDDLINEYKIERQVILDAEKARKQAIEDAVKLEADHEFALLLNKTWEHDRAEVLRLRDEELALIKKQADIDAEERAKSKAAHAEQVKVNEENARLANKTHCANVNNTILACLLDEGFSESEAKKFIRLAAQNKLPQLTINY